MSKNGEKGSLSVEASSSDTWRTTPEGIETLGAPAPLVPPLPDRLDATDAAALAKLRLRHAEARREMAHAEELFALYQGLVFPRYGIVEGDRIEDDGAITRAAQAAASP